MEQLRVWGRGRSVAAQECVKTELTVQLNNIERSATNKQKTANDESCGQFVTVEKEGAESEDCS